ncbi:hypothetical protein OHC33_002205 [Knufia fluminis]|uniref:Uncharacterized protein n=1 Tax=Knufia fluminis TaxID=191047 RepID=A0AAN8EJ79_9EURO|nr:hypothetical protein OHC33_002205 [Knufia fluminis]
MIDQRYSNEFLQTAPTNGRKYSVASYLFDRNRWINVGIVDDINFTNRKWETIHGQAQIRPFLFTIAFNLDETPGDKDESARRVGETFCRLWERLPSPVPKHDAPKLFHGPQLLTNMACILTFPDEARALNKLRLRRPSSLSWWDYHGDITLIRSTSARHRSLPNGGFYLSG